MEASDSLPEFREWIFFIPFPFPNFGNGFFHSLPVPEFREWIFSIPFPFPNFGNGFFQFPSRSRILKSHSRSPLLPSMLPVKYQRLAKTNGNPAASKKFGKYWQKVI